MKSQIIDLEGAIMTIHLQPFPIMKNGGFVQGSPTQRISHTQGLPHGGNPPQRDSHTEGFPLGGNLPQRVSHTEDILYKYRVQVESVCVAVLHRGSST